MAKQFVFICDGCDQRFQTADDELPSKWGEVGIKLSGLADRCSGVEVESEYHSPLLCGSCQARLRLQADPKEWPRNSAALVRGAVL